MLLSYYVMKVVATLLSHRCSTLVPDANGWIPVCYALWRENTGSVLLLLKVSDDNSLKQIRVKIVKESMLYICVCLSLSLSLCLLPSPPSSSSSS